MPRLTIICKRHNYRDVPFYPVSGDVPECMACVAEQDAEYAASRQPCCSRMNIDCCGHGEDDQAPAPAAVPAETPAETPAEYARRVPESTSLNCQAGKHGMCHGGEYVPRSCGCWCHPAPSPAEVEAAELAEVARVAELSEWDAARVAEPGSPATIEDTEPETGHGERLRDMTTDPIDQLGQLGAISSPNFDAYASGRIEAGAIVCVLCQGPDGCRCPRFGSRAYFALCNVRHGQPYTGPAIVCRNCGAEIELVDGGRTWRHVSTETLTGTRHVSCGHGGELGTDAAPTDD